MANILPYSNLFSPFRGLWKLALKDLWNCFLLTIQHCESEWKGCHLFLVTSNNSIFIGQKSHFFIVLIRTTWNPVSHQTDFFRIIVASCPKYEIYDSTSLKNVPRAEVEMTDLFSMHSFYLRNWCVGFNMFRISVRHFTIESFEY